MCGSHGWHARTRVRGTIGGLLAALLLLVLAAPASAAPPTCDPLSLTVHTGESVSGALQCTAPENEPLTYSVQDGPQHGFADVDGAGKVTYFSSFDHAGADSFTVLVDDQAGGTKVAQVSVDVTNSVPACQP